ncbi:cyclin-domain-containing protein [Hygrophoropsis aurantiaca]|uniref:Cyclin-domain-containing protein n=1 Tax=Hygrophoropsis aurantiaca TaxID=72124 RepID=A0ACB8A1E9_9AGAM|nr:cyclin-domain-containing protein [Hygrophoropsis aurantiaca]
MALYTPQSLPRTPSSCNMGTSLPSLPSELLATWSSWRPSRQTGQTGLMTPPMSSLPKFTSDRQVTSLPPIAHFDRQLSTMQTITPPRSQDASTSSRSIPQQDPVMHASPERYNEDPYVDQPLQHKPSMPPDAPHLVDWFDFSLKRSAHFIAEKTCEMICYLWFSTSLSSTARRLVASSQQTPSPPYSPEIPAASSALQFAASPTFVQFMQKLLETTQVSQSVIVLSLHYIFRLKERNRFTAGLPGSEFRIAVAALMMANKFLDDNTYTNKTWSEVSGIDLSEINRMEREFLVGIDFGLYVDSSTYESWLNLLKGLVMAKERESRQWRTKGRPRASRPTHPTTSGPATRTYRYRCHSTSHRARSTSPVQSTAHPRVFSSSVNMPVPHPYYSPTPNPGAKRSAADAFSPTSASFHVLPPLKRPTGMTLQIPETGFASGSSSGSPLESLQSFAKMSLSSSSPHSSRTSQSIPTPMSTSDNRPQTLVAAYRVQGPVNVPQNLYYYSLAGSSTGSETEQERVRGKARLRCYQPPPVQASYPPPPPYMPMDVQSASVSPHEIHMNIRQVPLPHIQDAVWSRKFMCTAPAYSPSGDNSLQLPPLRENIVPSAPFANAGPPGVQFYTSNQRGSPVYPYNWSYGR